MAKWGSLRVFYKENTTIQGKSSEKTTASIKSTSLQVYYQNMRGLRTKVDELYAGVLAEEYDLIILAETWLTDDFLNAELFDNRYHAVDNDRNDGRREGGVLVAARKCLSMQSVKLNIPDSSSIECLLVNIKVKKKLFYLCAVFIPPNVNMDVYVQFFNQFQCILDKYVDVIILGDFNLPLYSTEGCEKSKFLNNFLSFHNFNHHNSVYNIMKRQLDCQI